MSESSPICGLDGCPNQLNPSKYDVYYKREMCIPCFHKNEEHATLHHFGEWWELNYKEVDRPAEFWASVGAFYK